MPGPFTGSVAAILSGEKVNGTDLANWHDILQALTDPSTSYTPTTNATVGNGTLTAKYWQMGKLVLSTGRFILGSTSTLLASPTAITMTMTARTREAS